MKLCLFNHGFGRDTDAAREATPAKYLKLNQKQTAEIATTTKKNIEKKMEGFPTAVWYYKELVDVTQQEIRQARLKKSLSGK